MESRKSIYVGIGGTAPGEWENGGCVWHHTKVYVHPLIDGISDNLWKRIYNETNDLRPMCANDGSAVYLDEDNWQIVRKVGKQIIKIADITEVG